MVSMDTTLQWIEEPFITVDQEAKYMTPLEHLSKNIRNRTLDHGRQASSPVSLEIRFCPLPRGPQLPNPRNLVIIFFKPPDIAPFVVFQALISSSCS
ncbi:hypothetical protein AVEN_178173-1 [Araneus ventricosus]|uniref:Uncharacterized protein n=1 Tax=Araneus ventricosus TaxID=182803 RepID=A0A4Y2MJ39_ARAVE|nr:hypothetical protein AVEN_178173-1 [Araneus ventricosus]